MKNIQIPTHFGVVCVIIDAAKTDIYVIDYTYRNVSGQCKNQETEYRTTIINERKDNGKKY